MTPERKVRILQYVLAYGLMMSALALECGFIISNFKEAFIVGGVTAMCYFAGVIMGSMKP